MGIGNKSIVARAGLGLSVCASIPKRCANIAKIVGRSQVKKGFVPDRSKPKIVICCGYWCGRSALRRIMAADCASVLPMFMILLFMLHLFMMLLFMMLQKGCGPNLAVFTLAQVYWSPANPG